MPSINGGMKCIKYIMFLFNFILVVAGIALVWLGFSTKHDFARQFDKVLTGGDDGGHNIAPNILIAVGFIMFLIAFLGCCGAITENHCMMMLYSVLVGLILVIQLGGAIAAYAFQDDVVNALDKGMETQRNAFYDKNSESHNDTVNYWNIMQHTWQCCGIREFSDWANATDAPQKGFVPESCCIDGGFAGCTDTITVDTTPEKAAAIIFTEGCLVKGVRSLSHLGLFGIILAVIEVFGIIAACMMARSIRFSYETV